MAMLMAPYQVLPLFSRKVPRAIANAGDIVNTNLGKPTSVQLTHFSYNGNESQPLSKREW
jgi:hypothetical protein